MDCTIYSETRNIDERAYLRCIEISGHWRCAGYNSGNYRMSPAIAEVRLAKQYGINLLPKVTWIIQSLSMIG